MTELFYESGTFIKNYGVVGEPTGMTYKDGSEIHVGDIVELKFQYEEVTKEHSIMCKRDDGFGVMGIFDVGDIKFGKTSSHSKWYVRLSQLPTT